MSSSAKHQPRWLIATRIFGVSASLLLGFISFWFFTTPIDQTFVTRPSELSRTSVASARIRPEALKEVSFDAYPAISAKPVFEKYRRPPMLDDEPYASTKVTATSEPPPSEEVSLLGVLIDGDKKLALLASPPTSTNEWLPEGAIISGWRLEHVAHDRALLTAGGVKKEVYLYAAP